MYLSKIRSISAVSRLSVSSLCGYSIKRSTCLPCIQCAHYSAGGGVKSRSEIAIENKMTVSDIPKPQGSWQENYQERNRLWNQILAGSVVFFGVTLFAMYKYGVFFFNRLPDLKTIKVNANPSIDKSSEASSSPTLNAAPETVTSKTVHTDSETPVVHTNSESTSDVPTQSLPDEVPYLIIGAGPAASAACTAIRAHDGQAKVLVIGEENHFPYSRYPLSKELWFTDDKTVVENLQYKLRDGSPRSIYYEKEHFYCSPEELNSKENGGIAVATGRKVVKLDVMKQCAHLSDGTNIRYKKCLLATGGRPRSLPVLENAPKEVLDRTTLFRTIEDFKHLDQITQKVKSVAIIGGGFLGSELACALGKRASEREDLKIYQTFPEPGNMGAVLPGYLSKWCMKKIQDEGIKVLPGTKVVTCDYSAAEDKVKLTLDNGNNVMVDHLICAVGLKPNVELAESSGLEIDPTHGGFLVNAELEARSNVWVAGDASCFYDVRLGRRRVEHHDHAEVSGRLAGKNMTGAGDPYRHQSMFWSVLGPDIIFQAVGVIDSKLPTMAFFAKDSDKSMSESTAEKSKEGDSSETAVPVSPEVREEFDKGVVFYLKNEKVVGVLLWNVFRKSYVARQILKDGIHEKDIPSVAKLFNLHGEPEES